MQLSKTNKILIVIAFLLVLIGAYMILVRKNQVSNTATNTPATTDTNSTTTSAVIPGTNLVVQGSGYTITQVPVQKSTAPALPDLNRPVTFGATVNLTPEVKKMVTDKILALQATLKANPKDIGAWIDLGTYQKVTGDYAGSAISWKYVSSVSSNDYVSLGNLGDLYAYYLKDNGQAEVYYQTAISRAPKISYLYVQMSDMFKVVFHDLDKARAILDQGLSKIPNDPSLLEAKKNL